MPPYYEKSGIAIYHGDAIAALAGLDSESINCCVTSPPYWGLRDYGEDGQLGLESTPAEYVAKMVEVFREVRRVLRDDGTMWLNLGDSYTAGNQDGLKPKDLVGIPWRVAFALQADGWYLRQDIIWHKPNPMPESVTDRCTKAHEYIFLLTKSAKYWYDHEAVKEAVSSVQPPRAFGRKEYKAAQSQGYTTARDLAVEIGQGTDSSSGNHFGRVFGGETTRNKRSVWTVNIKPYSEAHFATFPTKLIEPCIQAGCPEGGTVLDPFFGSGTTGEVARKNGCKCIGIELNFDYCEIAAKRLAQRVLF